MLGEASFFSLTALQIPLHLFLPPISSIFSSYGDLKLLYIEDGLKIFDEKVWENLRRNVNLELKFGENFVVFGVKLDVDPCEVLSSV